MFGEVPHRKNVFVLSTVYKGSAVNETCHLMILHERKHVMFLVQLKLETKPFKVTPVEFLVELALSSEYCIRQLITSQFSVKQVATAQGCDQFCQLPQVTDRETRVRCSCELIPTDGTSRDEIDHESSSSVYCKGKAHHFASVHSPRAVNTYSCEFEISRYFLCSNRTLEVAYFQKNLPARETISSLEVLQKDGFKLHIFNTVKNQKSRDFIRQQLRSHLTLSST
uniref:FBD domain-containing protein n=1 Tax=Setaria digitata TaxID=48799 RepID=A0A915Q0N3_9BILA